MIKEETKQTVEEAAISSQCEMGCQDCPNHAQAYDGYYSSKNVKCPFILGVEWQSKQSPWISVKERLPEVGEHVLTKGAYGFLICYFSSLGEWETGANVYKERLGITHWMLIPSFDEILEANRDVLERIKEKGD